MTNLVLFEDNAPLRQSMKSLLNGVGSYYVSGAFPNARNAVKDIAELQPDIVIMDIDLPGVSGIEALRQIKESRPETLILMYTVFEDDDKLFESLCSGANGYILKNSSLNQLLNALNDLQGGGAPLSPGIAQKVLQSFHHKIKTNSFDLSDREIEILKFLVKGYSYKMIADECFISTNTVRSHIKNIYTKLHVNCGREAVSKALKNNIV